MEDLVAWIEGLFDDCMFRAPFGIGWHLDRAEPPITATVTPADCPTARIVLGRDDLLGRIAFVERLQAFLDLDLDRPVPPCPVHGVGLMPVRVSASVHWRCPNGDFCCPVGGYVERLWPPGPDEDPAVVSRMLVRRFDRGRVTGIVRFGTERHHQKWVATMTLRPDADVPAIRTAADPVVVEIDRIEREPVRTVRIQRPSTDTEPAHEALLVTGVATLLAALRGRLRRADPGEAWDFSVAGTAVRLVPEHQLGPPGSPVVLDGDGNAFADEGDTVCCVGGFLSAGPVQGQTAIFSAGELRVYAPRE